MFYLTQSYLSTKVICFAMDCNKLTNALSSARGERNLVLEGSTGTGPQVVPRIIIKGMTCHRTGKIWPSEHYPWAFGQMGIRY